MTRCTAKYHPWFHKLQQDEGYYDVFLFDTEGNLIYSVFKELDYATNFKRGRRKMGRVRPWRSVPQGDDASLAQFRRGFRGFCALRPEL